MDLRLGTSYRDILKMAMPISLAMVVPQINFVTNNIFLGGLGERELASAGITGVYYLIFAVVGNGLNNGLQALMARRAGENLHIEIGRFFFHGTWVALVFAALGIIITYSLGPMVLRSIIQSEAIADEVIGFLLIRIWGLPFLYLYGIRNALLVGTNQTKYLVWGTLAEALSNIFLDYGLIYGHFGLPAIGFNGAAYASIVAEGMGLLVVFGIIRYTGIAKSFELFTKWKWDNKMMKLIMVQSTPLILQFAISIASWEYFYLMIEHHGERALSISNTMRNIFGLTGIFSWAFAATANTMVSNLIGQKRDDDVMPLIWKIVKISFVLSFVIVIFLNIFPEQVLAVYNQNESFTTEAIPVVRIVSFALLLMSFSTIWLNAVSGTGNTKVNLIIEAITILLYCLYVYVVVDYLFLPITLGWLSEIVYWTSMFSMGYWYMKSGRWKGKVI